ncbi:MAG: hypothetical protein R3E97_16650 [Candidatus Eisenbacteria bacterium]
MASPVRPPYGSLPQSSLQRKDHPWRARARAEREIQSENEANFAHWEKAKDIVDQFIDMTLNYRQSGHPEGHARRSTASSGPCSATSCADIRCPENRYNDRFILVAGHCTPLLY